MGIVKRLNEMKPGEEGVIVDVLRGPSMLIKRILDMGLVKNTRVKVIRNAPLGDPVEFEALGNPVSLRRDEAKYIMVEVD